MQLVAVRGGAAGTQPIGTAGDEVRAMVQVRQAEVSGNGVGAVVGEGNKGSSGVVHYKSIN